MRAHRLAMVELRRITAGKMLRLAVVAFLLIPTLYAGLYLLANKDPYGHLDQVPAALVVEDEGATLADGSRINQGQAIADKLTSSGTFAWSTVDRAEAEAGVREQRYDFALVVPSTFSADLRSASTNDPHPAKLEQISNDANGYLARSIANSLVQQTTSAIASEVSRSAATSFLDGFSGVREKLTSARDGAAQLHDGLTTLRGKSDELVTGLDKLAAGATAAADGEAQVAAGVDQLSAGAAKLSDGATTLSSGAGQVSTGAGKLATGADTLSQGADSLASGAHDLAGGAASAASGAASLADGSAQVASGASTLQQNYATATAGAQKLAQGTAAYVAGIDATTAALPAKLAAAGLTPAQIQAVGASLAPLRDGAAQLDAGAQQLSSGLSAGTSGVSALATGAGGVSDGAAKLSAGTQAVSAGAAKLDQGAAQLAPGTHTLADSAHQLADGAAKVGSGASDLASGAGTLSSKSGELASGAHRAADGGAQLASGAKTAADGAHALPGGVDQLTDGAEKLRAGLAAGIDQLPATTPQQREAAAQVIGAPVQVDRVSDAQASTYGEGMAPFFLSLALWIGAYVLFLVIRPLSTRALAAGQPAWRIAVSGWMTPALLGVGQALLAYVVAVLGLGMHVAHPLRVVPFVALISLAFVALLQALAARFGAVGKFLGLVLLVLQLVSAGGTFPWQTLPIGLQWVHRVIPMTYAIDGLRHLMYGELSGQLVRDVLVLLGFLALGLAGGVYAARRSRVWTPARVAPDLRL